MEQPDGPLDGLTLDWSVVQAEASGYDVVFLAFGMAFLAWLLWLVYRTMQHPRLPVNRHDDRPPSANLAGVVRYLVTTPIMILFWLTVFLFLLSTAAEDRNAAEVIVAATAVIGGARLLAHTKEEIAHELAKTVPIAILGFIVIGGGFAGVEKMASTFDDVFGTFGTLFDSYYVGLILFDFVLTAIWFLAIRWSWLRARRRTDQGRPTEGLLGRIGDRLRRIGYATPQDEAFEPEKTAAR